MEIVASMRIFLLRLIRSGSTIFRNKPVASSVISRNIPSPARCRAKVNPLVADRIASALTIKSVVSHSSSTIKMLTPGFSGTGVRRTLTFWACRSLDLVFLVLDFDTSC